MGIRNLALLAAALSGWEKVFEIVDGPIPDAARDLASAQLYIGEGKVPAFG